MAHPHDHPNHTSSIRGLRLSSQHGTNAFMVMAGVVSWMMTLTGTEVAPERNNVPCEGFKQRAPQLQRSLAAPLHGGGPASPQILRLLAALKQPDIRPWRLEFYYWEIKIQKRLVGQHEE